MRVMLKWFHSNNHYIIILLVFFLFSLLLTPLGVFGTLISPSEHKGYYSITRIDPGDDTRIHAYLRSMVIDGDIDFFNEKGLWNRFELTPTGYSLGFMYAIGSTLLWLPFFLIGHCIAHLCSWLGYPITTDGFSFPYLVMTGIGSATYLFIGVILCYDLLSSFFTKSVALITATTVWLGTYLPFYAFIRSRMAHANEFFIISLLLYLWFYIRKERHFPMLYFLFGMVAGLACIIRMDDLPILSFFIIDFAVLLYRKYRLGERETLKKMIKGMGVFIFIFLLIFLLPFVCAHIIWGNAFALGGINAGGDNVSTPLHFVALILERSQLNNLWNFFLSEDKGLFLSSPFWLLALIGLWFFWKREKYWGSIILIGLSFPLIWNIIHTSTGLEYGIRRTTSALPFLCFGFAALFDYTSIGKWIIRRWLVFSIATLLIIWQYLQLIQHKILMEYNHPTFITTAFKNIPRILSESPDLLLRSSSWMKIVVLKDIKLQTFEDVFFIIAFPLVQLIALFFSLFLITKFKTIIRGDGYSTPLSFKIVSTVTGVFFVVLPLFLVFGNPQKTAAEIDERRRLVEEIATLEEQVGRSVIYYEESYIFKLLAQSSLKQQHLEKAEYYSKRAIERDPHDYQTRFMLAIAYQRTQRSEEAIEMYKKVLTLNPKHATTYKNLGVIYLNVLKDYDNALDNLRQSILLAPQQEQATEIQSVIARLTALVEEKQ